MPLAAVEELSDGEGAIPDIPSPVNKDSEESEAPKKEKPSEVPKSQASAKAKAKAKSKAKGKAKLCALI